MSARLTGPTGATVLLATLFTAAMLATGYLSFGIWTTLVFASGFLTGWAIWAVRTLGQPDRVLPPLSSLLVPYVLTFAAFVFLHRVEEYLSGFQVRLAAITGTPVPDVTSPALVLLLLTTVGAWIAAPLLVRRGRLFGHYLMWTFFAAMGITELAHFVFPMFTPEPYGYFPGMASVLVLAPLAWWGMWRLSGPHRTQAPASTA